jgi:hypothetical protein
VTALQSALYVGQVMHRRLRPRPHALRYSIFYLLLDLDEINVLANSLRLFSHSSFNLFSFRDQDHGNGSGTPLRDQVERYLREAGIEAGGPIRLLALPRILGYVFNPLSIYFCHRRDESLAAIIYEVNNTFGQRHHYVVPVSADSGAPIRQRSRKTLYVSPFMDTEMTYSFVVVPPGERLAVCVSGHDSEGPLIVAKLAAARRPLTDAGLARALVAYPLLTLKVIAGIHWQALLLWLKGVRLQPRPPPPDHPVTIGRQASSRAGTGRKDRRHVRQR